VDYFISSCYVHLRKPDPDIYQMALDTAQLPISHIIYIENIRMFVRTAKKLGIKSILHTDYESTSLKLASLGLKAD
jgi:putative hydrolase of the HAD superfamily